MRTTLKRVQSWLVFAGLICLAFALPVYAIPAYANQSYSLAYIESLRTTDHTQFVDLLKRAKSESAGYGTREKWELRYLEAWETQFEGNYAKAETELKAVIDESGDAGLSIKASSLLLNNYAATRRYAQGFALANALTQRLPEITGSQQRYFLLMNLSTILNLGGQTELAIRYADMMESARPQGENTCYPKYLRTAALSNAKRLNSSSPELRDAITTCTAAGQPVITNAIWLVLGDIYLDENQPIKALATLESIEANVDRTQYYPHIISARTELARAYEGLGRYSDAQRVALAAIALTPHADSSEWLASAYGVLYRTAKKTGNASAALSYYELYVEQNKNNLNDISARTMAYELSQQHMLVQKLETESLSKKNNILKLQQALATKAVETGHLYIALLLAIVTWITFWAFRTKRSQLRFRKLAYNDGLTGISHHQRFMTEAERCLRLLQKRSAHGCLVSIDLDHFKHVNDTHGHAIGDAVLRHMVAICKQQLRPHDIFGRLGGEEFGILLVDCPSAEGIFVADRIRMAIEASPLMEDGRVVTLSASVGVSCTGKSGYTLQKLCRDSDAALYRAKRSGRNRVVAHTEEDNQLIDGMPGSSLSNVTG
jgi:diguanylate cyclase (GGDEF)-like protein